MLSFSILRLNFFSAFLLDFSTSSLQMLALFHLLDISPVRSANPISQSGGEAPLANGERDRHQA
jgi:hypothetical protein